MRELRFIFDGARRAQGARDEVPGEALPARRGAPLLARARRRGAAGSRRERCESFAERVASLGRGSADRWTLDARRVPEAVAGPGDGRCALPTGTAGSHKSQYELRGRSRVAMFFWRSLCCINIYRA